MVDFVFSVFKSVVDVLRKRESAEDIEKELISQFHGRTYTITNYNDREVKITIETIRARPKFFPRESQNGIALVEGDNLFTTLDRERDKPTFRETLWARITGRWITTLKLNIGSGDAVSIRPSGLNLGHVSATTSLRHQGSVDTQRFLAPISPIRIADSHELQSDKLEIKILYDGSMGAYADRISGSVDLLQEIQNEMEYYAMIHLLDLHDSGKRVREDEFRWPDEEKVRNLGEYIFGHPLGLDDLEQHAAEIKAEIIEGE